MSEENKNTEQEWPAENIPEGIISTEQTIVPEKEQQLSTPNSQLSTSEDMEVHKHTHHVTHKKKWSEYLLEFFMLFLAVFLGFLAEYQLEHMIEKDREKQFVRSLINDITADTARLNQIISFRDHREKRLDSLTFLLNNNPGQTNDIYAHSITVTRGISIRFTPSDGTLQQLKNAGGLRLIRKRQVVDSITGYDVAMRNLVNQSAKEETLMLQYTDAAMKIFDALVFDRMLDENNMPVRPIGNPPLAPYTATELREFNFKLYPLKSINKSARRDERLFLGQAENLLVLLKKEYHLE